MRAVVVSRPGGLDRLDVTERPAPLPDRDEVVIAVEYAGCNWGDIQKRQGVYPDPVAYPAVLGAEVSGRIVKRGRGVKTLREGDRVAAITGPDMLRGFAEQVAVPAAYAIALPEGFDLRAAASFPIAALTAYHVLFTAHRLCRGETVLVHAVAGSVGLAVTQLATEAGVRVIGTTSSVEKAAAALAHGAARVVLHGEEDFVTVAMEETGGRGVDLVIDSLGGDVLPRSFAALRPFGRLINIGEASGEPDFAVRKMLYRRSTSMAGFEVLHAVPGSPRWRRGLRHVLGALDDGRLTIPVAADFPLERIRDAQAFMEGRSAAGKVVLRVRSAEAP